MRERPPIRTAAWQTTKAAGSVPLQQVSVNGRSYRCIPSNLPRTPQCCAVPPAP